MSEGANYQVGRGAQITDGQAKAKQIMFTALTDDTAKDGLTSAHEQCKLIAYFTTESSH